MDDTSFLSAAELARRVRVREMSPRELVEHCIERIERRDPSINAFVHRDFEGARVRAKQAERAVMAGEALGPLHGVPTAMKDLLNPYSGWPGTLGGIRALKDRIDDGLCLWAERMEDAGAILLGKTNSPTMGMSGVCDNFLFGPTRNPFDTERNSGGSSGGAAAAVADGLVSIAEGTDGGGSIRIPAAWCGLFGYKAAAGRVPTVIRPNAFGGVNPFLFEGTLTRTVADAALGLEVLAGHDPRDPFSLDEPLTGEGNDGGVAGKLIAYSPDLDIFPVEPEVASCVSDAVSAFEEAGANVEQVRLDLNLDQRELGDLWCRMVMPLHLEVFDGLASAGLDLLRDHRDDFPPEYLDWIEQARSLTVQDLSRDQAVRTQVFDAVQRVLGSHDLLISPTLACGPVKNSTDGSTTYGPTAVAGAEVNKLIGWCLTYPINFTGHPAASIPAGLAGGRHPVGMQIVGRRYADRDVLAASRAFEQLRPWNHIYRLCAERSLEM